MAGYVLVVLRRAIVHLSMLGSIDHFRQLHQLLRGKPKSMHFSRLIWTLILESLHKIASTNGLRILLDGDVPESTIMSSEA